MSEIRSLLDRAVRDIEPSGSGHDDVIDRWKRRDRRRRLGAGVVALVVATGGAAFAVRSFGVPGRGSPAEGPGGLQALAPGEYLYLRIRTSTAVDGHFMDRETWWASDGSGEVRDRGSRPDKYRPLPDGAYGAGRFPAPTDVSMLSTDPARLEAQLLERGGAAGFSSPAEGVWTQIRYLLLEVPHMGPDLRAALFEVARTIESATMAGEARDPAGRSAVAVEFAYDGVVQRAFFDPATRQFMGWTSSYGGGSPSWAVVESGIVAVPGERPEGEEWLFSPLPADLDLPGSDLP